MREVPELTSGTISGPHPLHDTRYQEKGDGVGDGPVGIVRRILGHDDDRGSGRKQNIIAVWNLERTAIRHMQSKGDAFLYLVFQFRMRHRTEP